MLVINWRISFALCMLGLFTASALHAQGDNVDLENLWSKARYYTNEEINYPKAEQLAKSALEIQPRNQDLNLLLAKIYWRSEQFSSAEKAFKKIITESPKNYDVYIQFANFYESQNKLSDAYRLILKALIEFPLDETFMFRKTYNLELQGYYFLAFNAAKELLQVYPDNQKVRYIHDTHYHKFVNNFVLASYNYYYSESSEALPLSFYNFQYGRGVKSSNLIGGITMLNSNGKRNIQYTAEMYSAMNHKTSSYIALFASASDVFPRLKIIGEVMRALPEGYEACLRINTMILRESTVHVWSPCIGKYYRDYYFIGAVNFIKKPNETEVTYNLRVRRYFENPQTFVGLSIGSIPSDDIIGFRPDENMTATFIAFDAKLNFNIKTDIGMSYLRNISRSASSRDLVSLFAKRYF